MLLFQDSKNHFCHERPLLKGLEKRELWTFNQKKKKEKKKNCTYATIVCQNKQNRENERRNPLLSLIQVSKINGPLTNCSPISYCSWYAKSDHSKDSWRLFWNLGTCIIKVKMSMEEPYGVFLAQRLSSSRKIEKEPFSVICTSSQLRRLASCSGLAVDRKTVPFTSKLVMQASVLIFAFQEEKLQSGNRSSKLFNSKQDLISSQKRSCWCK